MPDRLLQTMLVVTLVLFSEVGSAGPFYLGGIQVNEPEHETWARTLEQEGMNTVQVTAYAFQGDWDSAELFYKKEVPGLESEIRAAKARGMKVVFILRTALDHARAGNKFLWHGMIMPGSDEELERWFEKYTEYALHWAGFARREGVDILGIASEMNSLTSTLPVDRIPGLQDWYLNRLNQQEMKELLLLRREEIAEEHLWVRGFGNYTDLEAYLNDRQSTQEAWARKTARLSDNDPIAKINDRRLKLDRAWRKVIERVRAEFKGPITYAANFDQYHEVGFWDALDIMGINAYFPLRRDLLEEESRDRLESMLVEGWSRAFSDIGRFARRLALERKPILFTELGYTRRSNCTLEPWADSGFSIIEPTSEEQGKKLVIWKKQPIDPSERALAVRALYRASRNRTENPLIGVLYWKLSTVPSHQEIEPFACIIGTRPKDPLLEALQKFR